MDLESLLTVYRFAGMMIEIAERTGDFGRQLTYAALADDVVKMIEIAGGKVE